MIRTCVLSWCLAAWVCGSAGVRAAEEAPAAVDEATQKRIDGKAERLLKAVQLEDAEKASRVKAIWATGS